MSVTESTVEKRFRERVKEVGGQAYKFVSPGRRGVPDRLVLYPIPEAHKDTVARYVHFVELKAPKRKPTPQQAREHEKLRNMGFCVEVVDK